MDFLLRCFPSPLVSSVHESFGLFGCILRIACKMHPIKNANSCAMSYIVRKDEFDMD